MNQQIEILQLISSRRQMLRWGLAAAVVALAGMVNGGCMMQPVQTAQSSGGGRVVQIGGGSGAPQMFELKGARVTPAPGLPTGEPDVIGLYLRREDQSIFLGTGEIQMRVTLSEGGQQPAAEASASGPTVEVVVNRNTEIYMDVTEISLEARRDGLEVQQLVEPLDSLNTLLESVNKTDTLTVWGNRSGDRIIARVIVYRPADIYMRP